MQADQELHRHIGHMKTAVSNDIREFHLLPSRCSCGTLTSLRGAEVVRGGVRTLSFAVEGGDGQLVARVQLQPRHLL